MRLKELREKRAAVYEQMRKLLEAAKAEERDLNAEEEEKWQALNGQYDQLSRQIEREERLAEIDAEQRQQIERLATEGREKESDGGEQKEDWLERAVLINRALQGWFLYGTPAYRDEHAAAAAQLGFSHTRNELEIPLLATAPQNEAELRAQGVGTDSAGGYLVPEQLRAEVERALLAFGGVRPVATVIRTAGGGDLDIPTVNDTSNKGVILAENTQVTEQDVTFGQVTLSAYKYSSKMVRVSVELLQDSAVNVESLIGSLLGERIARILNEHFTTGSGSGQPEGIVTGATVGVTAASTSAITYDELVDLVHSVDVAYRQGAKWMMHDQTVATLRKLTDNNGLPIWQPSMTEGEPQRLLGYPVVINNDMAQIAASAKVILFGQFRKYWIRDVRRITLLRLNERYADYHQVAFLAFSRHDGKLIDAGTNPVKVLQMAAA